MNGVKRQPILYSQNPSLKSLYKVEKGWYISHLSVSLEGVVLVVVESVYMSVCVCLSEYMSVYVYVSGSV